MADKISDELLQLWPYASDQFVQIMSVLNRLTTWKAVTNTLLNYFGTLQDTERQLGKEHEKLHKSLEKLEHSLGGESGAVLRPWRNYAQFFECEYLSTENLVATSALRHLKALKAEIKRKICQYESDIKSYKNGVVKARNLTLSGISVYERNLSKRSNALKTDSGVSLGTTYTSDPWLSERSLYYQLQMMVKGENDFQKSIQALFENIATFDSYIVATIMQTMNEFSTARISQWESMQKHLTSVQSFSALSEPAAHFEVFSSAHHIHSPEIWQQTRTLQDFPYQVREIQILKHGVLHIPSKFSKNSWLPVVAVITETGFFHCFKISAHKHSRLMEWIAQQQMPKEMADNELNSPAKSFLQSEIESVTSTSTTWPSLSTLRKSQSNSIQPLSPEEVYRGADRPSAAISVGLKQPRITIQLVPEKSNQHIFELIIQRRRPRSGGFFGAWARPSVDAWTRFEFKASNELELIEWLAALQGRIQNFVPQGPPSPLFKSQQSIEKSVEAMIKEHHERALTDIVHTNTLHSQNQQLLSRIRQATLPNPPLSTSQHEAESQSMSLSTLKSDSCVISHDECHSAMPDTLSYKTVSMPESKPSIYTTPRVNKDHILNADEETKLQECTAHSKTIVAA
ncbi:hypothetical protein RTP6_004456 [Batrachochytrium dendrobatidis]